MKTTLSRQLYSLFLVCFLFNKPFSQSTYMFTYGSENDEYAVDVAVTNDNGFIVVGWTNTLSSGEDGYIAKFNSLGEAEWALKIGGSNDDRYKAASLAPNGDVIVIGETRSFGSGNTDFFITRVTPSGGVIWSKEYGGSSIERANGIHSNLDGTILVTGSSQNNSFGEEDLLLFKTDMGGNLIWNKQMGGNSADYLHRGIYKTEDGYLLPAGTSSWGAGQNDGLIVKISEDGNREWSKVIGGPLDESFQFVTTYNQNIFIGGNTWSWNSGNNAIWFLTTDLDGNINWSKTYGIAGKNIRTWHITRQQNRMFISGYDFSNTPNKDGYLLEINPTTGNILWSKKYGKEEGEDVFYLVKPYQDGLLAIGWTNSYGNGDFDIFVAKTDLQGNVNVSDACDIENVLFTITDVSPNSTEPNFNEQTNSWGSSITPNIQSIIGARGGVCTTNLPVVADITTTMKIYCINDCPTLYDASINEPNFWEWTIVAPSNEVMVYNEQNVTSFCATEAGIYDISLYSSNSVGGDSTNIQITVEDTFSFSVGNDTILCEGTTTMLSVNTSTENILWNTGQTTPIISITEAGEYWVEAFNGGCTQADTISVISEQTPIVTLPDSIILCSQSSGLLEPVFSGNVDSVLWSNGYQDSTLLVQEEGVYSVYASNICGTDSATTFISKVNPVYIPTIDSSYVICYGDSILINVYQPNAISYMWSDSSTYFKNWVHNTGAYEVSIMNECNAITTNFWITEVSCCDVYIPNAFSPNQNGVNDIFFVYTNCRVQDFNIKIFDRWGNFVFESNDIKMGWDGTFRNKEVIQGVYTYIYSFFNGLEIVNGSGDVTVIR